METRLFWIGIAMGAYAYASRWAKTNGKLGSRTAAALWHGLFLGLAGFAVTLIAVLSINARISLAGPTLRDFGDIFPALLGGLVLGVFGFWRAYAVGKRVEKRRFFLNEDLEWAETVFSAILLAALLMYFIVQAFKIPSGSMKNTLLIGDHLFVNKFIYGVRIPLTGKRLLKFKKVGRRDIIVFRFPTEDSSEEHCGTPQYGKDFIKRVIGIPGDVVEVKDGVVWINGARQDEDGFAIKEDGRARVPRPQVPLTREQYQLAWEQRQLDGILGDAMKDNFGPVTVPKESYMVMGDNRDYSCDGRFWGPVHEKYLKGKAWVIYWPVKRMGGIR
jgi:signal peptidase I